MKHRCTLHPFDDATTLAAAAATRWHALLAARPAQQPFTVALSGGRIPKLLYEAFVTAITAHPLSLEGLHFFWGDERCVPPDDAESNFALAHLGLLQPLRVPSEQIHRIQTELDETQMLAEAETALRLVTHSLPSAPPVLDLIFLGMGEDGHVASIFPGDSEAFSSNAVYRAVTGSKPPPRRVTLGLSTIAAARQVWVLISGAGKQTALHTSLADNGRTPLSYVLRSRTHTEIFTDFPTDGS